MSKKKSGLLIAFGAMLGGAVAAGISYYLKLKSFNDELDQDFHEYEEEDSPSDENEEKAENAPERTYITIKTQRPPMILQQKKKKIPIQQNVQQQREPAKQQQTAALRQRDLQQMKKHPPL